LKHQGKLQFCRRNFGLKSLDLSWARYTILEAGFEGPAFISRAACARKSQLLVLETSSSCATAHVRYCMMYTIKTEGVFQL
jgi:hypothetical protein